MADDLKQASDRFIEITQQVRSLLETTEGVALSSASHFKGLAAVEFRAQMVRYKADAANLNGALGQIAEAVAVSGKTFDAADAGAQAAFKSAGSGLNAS